MTKNRVSPYNSYTELDGVPGFVYIARNDMHGEHIYKVGSTGQIHPKLRQDTLNRTYAQGKEAALGFFEFQYEAETLDAGGTEKLAHESLKRYRIKNAGATEFFKAPIHDIMAAIDIAVKTANEKQKLKQLKGREEEITKKEPERKPASFKSQNPQNYFQPPTPIARPSPPIEIIDLKCPSCNIELKLARPQANNSKQLRCMGCKHLFHWSDWLEKKATDLELAQRNDVIPAFVLPKTKEEQKTDNAVRKGIAGLFAAMLAFPFLIATLTTQDKPAIVPPVASVIPATAPQQVVPIQTPIAETVQSQPIATATATEHHTKVTAKSRLNKPSKEGLQEIEKTNAYEMQAKANQVQVNSDLQAIADRAIRDYPYLNSPEGQKILDRITAKRDVYISQGVYPSIALTRAVNDFAPAYAPQAARKAPQVIEAPAPVVPTVDSQGCGWVSSIEWKCKQ